MKIGSLTWITDIIRLISPEIGYADLDRLQVMQVDSREWLESKYAQVIDPDLQLYSGTQYSGYFLTPHRIAGAEFL